MEEGGWRPLWKSWAAAQLISDGETLIANGGSTVFAFATSLGARRNLTIVTNNVAMLPALSPETFQDVYVLGGDQHLELAKPVSRLDGGGGSDGPGPPAPH